MHTNLALIALATLTVPFVVGAPTPFGAHQQNHAEKLNLPAQKRDTSNIMAPMPEEALNNRAGQVVTTLMDTKKRQPEGLEERLDSVPINAAVNPSVLLRAVDENLARRAYSASTIDYDDALLISSADISLTEKIS